MLGSPSYSQYFPKCQTYKTPRCLEKCSQDTAYACFANCLAAPCTEADELLPPPNMSRMAEYDQKVKQNIQNARQGGAYASPTPPVNYNRPSNTAESAENQDATRCLSITKDSDGSSAIRNSCAKRVHFSFCGTDSGDGELVGICGKDVGGSVIEPGQIISLTQGRQAGVIYHWVACYWPYSPYDVKTNATGLYGGRCVR